MRRGRVPRSPLSRQSCVGPRLDCCGRSGHPAVTADIGPPTSTLRAGGASNGRPNGSKRDGCRCCPSARPPPQARTAENVACSTKLRHRRGRSRSTFLWSCSTPLWSRSTPRPGRATRANDTGRSLHEVGISVTDQVARDLKGIARTGDPDVVRKLQTVVSPQLRRHPRQAASLTDPDPPTGCTRPPPRPAAAGDVSRYDPPGRSP